jgi:hypothetical protein
MDPDRHPGGEGEAEPEAAEAVPDEPWIDEEGHVHPGAKDRVLPEMQRRGRVPLVATAFGLLATCVLMVLATLETRSISETLATIAYTIGLCTVVVLIAALYAPFLLRRFPRGYLAVTMSAGFALLIHAAIGLFLWVSLSREQLDQGSWLRVEHGLAGSMMISLVAGFVVLVTGVIATEALESAGQTSPE